MTFSNAIIYWGRLAAPVISSGRSRAQDFGEAVKHRVVFGTQSPAQLVGKTGFITNDFRDLICADTSDPFQSLNLAEG